MEVLEIIGFWCFGAAIGAILAIIASFLLKDKLSERKIARLEEEIDDLNEDLRSYKTSEYASRGKVMRQESQERMEAALGEAVVLMKSGKQPIDAIKEVAVKYPDVAFKLAKKYGLGI